MNTFDFSDLVDEPAAVTTTPSDTPPWETNATPIQQWAGEVVSQAVARDDTRRALPVIFDIETGPRPVDELRATYREKTLDEFAAECDKRWKPETVAAKFEEYKAKAWDEYVAKAALSPVSGRVLLIGVLIGEDFIAMAEGDEPDKLSQFWDLVECTLGDKQPLIGHNSNGFDIPFLVRRSWLLGVPVPREVRQGRYWNSLFRDTMEWWNCGQGGYVKLNTVAGFFNCGQKTEGVSGGDFSKLWFGEMPADAWGTPEQQRLKAIEYNGQDLRLTAAIAAKMGMI